MRIKTFDCSSYKFRNQARKKLKLGEVSKKVGNASAIDLES